MGYSIGVDLGGTYTKIGLVNSDGAVLFSKSIPTPKDKDFLTDSIFGGIVEFIERSGKREEELSNIGIAVAGPVKTDCGIIESITNLPIKNFNLVDILKDRLTGKGISKDIPIKLINDADAAAIAEYKFGAGKGYSDMSLITVGTGIGCGIIAGGKLYKGNGTAGEIGHTVVEADGRICGGCGKRGCLEAYASVSALIKNANRLRSLQKVSILNNYEKLNGEIIFECYFAHDIAAAKAVKKFIYYLSVGIINLYCTLSPSCIVIGGGISRLKDKLINLLNEQCAELSKGFEGTESPTIVYATLLGNAGIIGACVA